MLQLHPLIYNNGVLDSRLRLLFYRYFNLGCRPGHNCCNKRISLVNHPLPHFQHFTWRSARCAGIHKTLGVFGIKSK